MQLCTHPDCKEHNIQYMCKQGIMAFLLLDSLVSASIKNAKSILEDDGGKIESNIFYYECSKYMYIYIIYRLVLKIP